MKTVTTLSAATGLTLIVGLMLGLLVAAIIGPTLPVRVSQGKAQRVAQHCTGHGGVQSMEIYERAVTSLCRDSTYVTTPLR